MFFFLSEWGLMFVRLQVHNTKDDYWRRGYRDGSVCVSVGWSTTLAQAEISQLLDGLP